MVNAEGGVDGRTVKLAYQEDDGSRHQPTVAQKLVEQDKVFAVVGVATAFFAGAHSWPSRVRPPSATVTGPTGPGRNLFADYGSVLCFAATGRSTATWPSSWAPSRSPSVAYGVPQSAAACQRRCPGMQVGVHVWFSDLSVLRGRPHPGVSR